ncbi:MAG: copper resistance protein [Alphaproteobacteria bacterium]|nr:copper resistance protein [Alphaproteobacteria bacterium]
MRFVCLLLLLTGFAAPATAYAAASDWAQDDTVSVRLVSGVEAAGDHATVPLGLEIRLAEGWHTYWRTPGETGFPPALDWGDSLSEQSNLQSADLFFPAPHRFSEMGLETLGYEGNVLLPIEAHVRTPGRPLALKASLNLLVCKTLCEPKTFALSLNLPAGPADISPEATLIETSRTRVPTNNSDSGLSITAVERHAEGLHITAHSDKPFTEPDLFIETGKPLLFSRPEISLAPDRQTATISLRPQSRMPDGITLTDLSVTVTLVDGARALEQKLDSSFVPPPQPAPSRVPTFWSFLLLALLGGFILNFMPCVLPVLSLKILGLIHHKNSSSAAVRHSFLMTAAGILTSFLLLAGMTILLKETGHMIGWGVQFQQPLFLVFMVFLLVLFAANLWGFFEIPLPRFLAENINRPSRSQMAGAFATGAFATLLATPCSAPFLGTAIGFALTSGKGEIVVIFAALGSGLALPYLAIALWPRLAKLLPRPGAWMIKLRALLGFFLALTAVWLLAVLTAQIALWAAGLVGAAAFGALIILFLHSRANFRRYSWTALILLAAISFGAAMADTAPAPLAAPQSGWGKFDEAALARYVREGKTVFVDITADWCVNCKANEKLTLSREEVVTRLFHDPNIIAMKGDWTSPDPILTAYLQKNGRYGIPFNAVYGPGAPQGILLPELITPSLVLKGLNIAAKNP